jgi:hypothetical protein
MLLRNENRRLLQLVKATVRDRTITASPIRTVYKAGELVYSVNVYTQEVG